MLRRRPLNLKRRWVLITGASSGLGREMARQLALEHDAYVLLCGRNEARLQSLEVELKSMGAGALKCLRADLSTQEGIEKIQDAIKGGLEVDLHALILNAGVTHFGYDLDQSAESFQQLLDTNVKATVLLARSFARQKQKLGHPGAMMIVSSLASINPLPFQAAYSGSKAFLTNYGLALGHELKKDKINVTVFSPGGIATEMLQSSGLSKKFSAGDLGIMDVQSCARAALRAMIEGRVHAIPGSLNQILALLSRIVPRELLLAQTASIYRGAVSTDPHAPSPAREKDEISG